MPTNTKSNTNNNARGRDGKQVRKSQNPNKKQDQGQELDYEVSRGNGKSLSGKGGPPMLFGPFSHLQFIPPWMQFAFPQAWRNRGNQQGNRKQKETDAEEREEKPTYRERGGEDYNREDNTRQPTYRERRRYSPKDRQVYPKDSESSSYSSKPHSNRGSYRTPSGGDRANYEPEKYQERSKEIPHRGNYNREEQIYHNRDRKQVHTPYPNKSQFEYDKRHENPKYEKDRNSGQKIYRNEGSNNLPTNEKLPYQEIEPNRNRGYENVPDYDRERYIKDEIDHYPPYQEKSDYGKQGADVYKVSAGNEREHVYTRPRQGTEQGRENSRQSIYSKLPERNRVQDRNGYHQPEGIKDSRRYQNIAEEDIEGYPSHEQTPRYKDGKEIRKSQEYIRQDRNSQYSVKDIGQDRNSQYSVKDIGQDRNSQYSVKDIGQDRNSQYSVKDIGQDRNSQYSVKDIGQDRNSQYSVKDIGQDRNSHYSVKDIGQDKNSQYSVKDIGQDRNSRYNVKDKSSIREGLDESRYRGSKSHQYPVDTRDEEHDDTYLGSKYLVHEENPHTGIGTYRDSNVRTSREQGRASHNDQQPTHGQYGQDRKHVPGTYRERDLGQYPSEERGFQTDSRSYKRGGKTEEPLITGDTYNERVPTKYPQRVRVNENYSGRDWGLDNYSKTSREASRFPEYESKQDGYMSKGGRERPDRIGYRRPSGEVTRPIPQNSLPTPQLSTVFTPSSQLPPPRKNRPFHSNRPQRGLNPSQGSPTKKPNVAPWWYYFAKRGPTKDSPRAAALLGPNIPTQPLKLTKAKILKDQKNISGKMPLETIKIKNSNKKGTNKSQRREKRSVFIEKKKKRLWQQYYTTNTTFKKNPRHTNHLNGFIRYDRPPYRVKHLNIINATTILKQRVRHLGRRQGSRQPLNHAMEKHHSEIVDTPAVSDGGQVVNVSTSGGVILNEYIPKDYSRWFVYGSFTPADRSPSHKEGTSDPHHATLNHPPSYRTGTNPAFHTTNPSAELCEYTCACTKP